MVGVEFLKPMDGENTKAPVAEPNQAHPPMKPLDIYPRAVQALSSLGSELIISGVSN